MADGLKAVDLIVPVYNEEPDVVAATVSRIGQTTVTGRVP